MPKNVKQKKNLPKETKQTTTTNGGSVIKAENNFSVPSKKVKKDTKKPTKESIELLII